MARKPKHSHPVRELRAIIQKTQSQFADMIGIKADTLKKYENRQREMPKGVAKLIHVATGAHTRFLMAGKLRNVWGHEYMPGFYQQWGEGYWPQSDGIAIEKALRLAPWLEILLRGAARKNRLWLVFARVVEMLNDCREEFGLGVSIDKVLEENPDDYEFRLPGMPTDKVKWDPSPRSMLQVSWLGRYRREWMRREEASKQERAHESRRNRVNRRRQQSSHARKRA
jgi:transcriptional regulator with XRE-family HTH domain